MKEKMTMTRYYTQSHERIDIDGDIATVGISRHAVDQLGDVVFVEHPEVGGNVAAGDALSVVESTKAASDVYAPLSGTVTEVNTEIEENPALVSDDHSESVWFFKIKLSDASEINNLLSPEAYKDIAE